MSNRNRKFVSGLALSALVALVAGTLPGGAAQARILACPEEAIEASTDTLTLPTQVGGSVVARLCDTCSPMVLRMTGTTRFFMYRREVSLAELAHFLGSDRTARGLNVFFDKATHDITRVVVSANLP